MDFLKLIIEKFTNKLIIDEDFRKIIGLFLTIASGTLTFLFSSMWQIANHKFNLNKFFTDLKNSKESDGNKQDLLTKAHSEYVTLEKSERIPLDIMTVIFSFYIFGILALSGFFWLYISVTRSVTREFTFAVAKLIFLLTLSILYHLIVAIMLFTFRPRNYVAISRKIRNHFLK